jgi:O-antigen/teichoic acid export membrane protein
LLGPENYGTLSLLTTIMGLAYSFSSLGLESSMPFFLAKYKESQRDLIKKFLKIRGVLIIIASITLLLLSGCIIDYYGNPELKDYLPIIAISLPFFIIMNIAPHILQGLKNLKSSSIADLIFNIAKSITLPFIMLWGLAGALFGYLASYISHIIYSYKKIFELSKKSGKKFSHYAEITRFSLINYASTIIFYISSSLLPLILGKNELELGYFDASLRIGMIITLPSTALITAMIPSLIGKNAEEKKSIVSKIITYIAICAIPLISFFLFSPNFAAKAILGDEFSSIGSIIQIAAIINLFNIIISLFDALSYSAGKNKYITIRHIISLAAILMLSSQASTAQNTSLIMLFSTICAAGFIMIMSMKYCSIDLKAMIKTIIFCMPLVLFFAIDMDLWLKIFGAALSSIIYLILVWKKALDKDDRELFAKFAIKIKSMIAK